MFGDLKLSVSVLVSIPGRLPGSADYAPESRCKSGKQEVDGQWPSMCRVSCLLCFFFLSLFVLSSQNNLLI